MTKEFISGKQMGVVQCGLCHRVLKLQDKNNQDLYLRCPVCNSKILPRKPSSISKTWALLITSVIFYIPANVLPMTIATSMWGTQSDNIVSGVIYFVKSGLWPIALIIFVASVIVPLLKITTLSFLLISVMRKSKVRPVERTRLYRITELIGRWSMMDVYVITILVGLVNMGAVGTFKAGPAAVYFCMVVILTMAAAISFDPRLIWDEMECEHE